MEKRLESTTQVRVRYQETDNMGIVYNANYYIYFDVGRVELMRDFDMLYTDLEAAGFQLPLIESGSKFIKPAHFDDVLDIKTVCVFDKGVRIEFQYEIYHGEELLNSGFTRHVFYDSVRNKPVRVPQIFLDAYAKAMEQL